MLAHTRFEHWCSVSRTDIIAVILGRAIYIAVQFLLPDYVKFANGTGT